MSASPTPKHAVILAGGKGTRLKPYTITFPKPLVPVGDMPILEIVIRQLKQAGFEKVTMAVGHLAELLISYFGDGSKWGLEINYSREDEPHGTVGPLKLIEDLPEQFLVMNGDVLTTLRYDEFFDYHIASGVELTAALGLIQIGKLSKSNARRMEMAQHYWTFLADVTGLTLPFSDRLEDSSHHIFPIILDQEIDRSEFRELLKERGIQTSVHYPPIHQFSFYRDTILNEPCHLPVTEDIAGREVTLPLHPLLEKEDVEHISKEVCHFFDDQK